MGKKFLLLFSAVCWGAFYTYADECLCNECKCAQKQRSSGMGGSGNRQRGFGMGGSGNRQRGFGMGGGGNRQRGFGMGGGNFRKPKPAEPSQELVNDSNLRRLEFTSSNGTVKYCEFLENPDAPGKMHLVLLLHGLSNSGNDNLRQLAMPAIKPLLDFLRKNKIKALVLIPQCPEDKSWIRDKDMLSLMHDLVVSKQKKYTISSERSIISGFSMGGGAGFSYMMEYPGTFKKAIIVSAGGRIARPDKLKGDFYIAVGSEDRFVSSENTKKMVDKLKQKNNVRFEMPDLDHIQTGTQIYSGDCWEWAFEIK